VISVKGDVALVRLDGRLKMKHPFYPGRDDEAFVSATLLGYAEIETTESARAAGIRRLELVTVAARYGDGRSDMPFGVAVRSARGAE